MGPLRRGLIFAICLTLPHSAQADTVCAKVRPNWDGSAVSAWTEALLLMGTPISLVLLLATALAARFRSSWGALAVFVGWSFAVAAVTFLDPTDGLRTAAVAEGCVGSPTLYIAAVALMSIGLVLYTSPKPKQEDQPD